MPDDTYVSAPRASQHDAATVYAAFDNHKNGDFKPYLLQEHRRGQDAGPRSPATCRRAARSTSLAEDHVDPNLLFAGTEFGLFFTHGRRRELDASSRAACRRSPVRDLAIQKRENDLVVGTFGRGFYVLDDYSPLRAASAGDARPGRRALPGAQRRALYMPDDPARRRGKAFLGDAFYTAPNPPFGAVFTYYLKDELKTKKKARQEAEKEAAKEGRRRRPTRRADELRAEAERGGARVLFTVTDADGNVVRRLTGPATAGFHRVAWDLRFPPSNPTRHAEARSDDPVAAAADRPAGRARHVHASRSRSAWTAS